jgi:hypothetical protein
MDFDQVSGLSHKRVNCLLRLPLLLFLLPALFTGIVGHCQGTLPSTFGTTVGYTLLCLNPLNEIYFREYLIQTFGQPYKREEGAYWFKSNAKLWGVSVTDVLVSDETSAYTFLAAVLDTKPEKLNDAIANSAGLRHTIVGEASRSATTRAATTTPTPTPAPTPSPALTPVTYPIRQAQTGSQIIHFQQKSKIFCSKSRYLVPN